MIKLFKGDDGFYHLDFSALDISKDYTVSDHVDPLHPDIIQINVRRKCDSLGASVCFSVEELKNVLVDHGCFLQYYIHNMIKGMPPINFDM